MGCDSNAIFILNNRSVLCCVVYVHFAISLKVEFGGSALNGDALLSSH